MKAAVKRFPELTDDQIIQAQKETAHAEVCEARAVAVRYDTQSENLVLALRGGMTLLIPIHLLQGVAGAEPELIEKVVLRPDRANLHWEELDADFSVQGLLAGSFGNAVWMKNLQEQGLLDSASEERLTTLAYTRNFFASRMGQKGGSARTQAKTAASRENGRKGGRPRKVA